MPPPLPPLCRRRLPLPAGSRSTKGRPPLQPAPPRASPLQVMPLLAAALAGAALTGGASARRLPSCGRRTCSRPPLAGIVLQSATLGRLPLRSGRERVSPLVASPCRSRPPLFKGPWPQPAATYK
ncbi:hypothetical protein BHM03_00040864 [Ensete ventricosum]|nr:hypothetical protein BHM03_00040864 [Ensete ventricosum]